MKRYIITGAPGTGKTTLIDALRNNNFYCFEEVSRRIIISEQQTNGNKTPWEDVVGFTDLVYEKTIEELKIPTPKTTFVDRGLPDNIAYLKLQNQIIDNQFLDFNYKQYYNTTVFILSPWKKIYVKDPQRLQSFEQTKKLHTLLLQTYKDLGFSIHFLPNSTLLERKQLIIDIVNKESEIGF